MKLYRVKLRGMHLGLGTGTAYGEPYVVADDPTEALTKVQDYLRENDIGFREDRELASIELLAESGDYPECRVQLYL